MQAENGVTSALQAPRRFFGWFEAAFDSLYLVTALYLATFLLSLPQTPVKSLAGVMGLVLVAGDLFHLVPRILVAAFGQGRRLGNALGRGKMITSVTMTVFYVLLWHVGLLLWPHRALREWTTAVYALAACRTGLCLLPQNQWRSGAPPLRWAIYRNVPFVLLGAVVAILYGHIGTVYPALSGMITAIALSFACYLPAALLAGRYRMLGILMLPKTLTYLWMLWMFTTL